MNIVHASVKAHWGPDLAIKHGILSLRGIDINLLSWTDYGFQTGLTYLELLKQLVIELDKPGINHTKSKPFVLLTDGHTSRPTFPVHGFCELNKIPTIG
eukprot:m.348519 g.348519  ORF g.348519 m.348519 type:complete len:99 (-) comp16147_c0_seq48:816-1112(-)